MPHVPIRLCLCKKPRRHRELFLKKVKQFPRDHPVGCAPKPPSWETEAVAKGLQGKERINILHAFFLRNFESEMCGLYGIPQEDQWQYRGRADKPKLVWRQAGGAPAQHHPSSGREGRQWRLLQRRLEDLHLALNRSDPAELETKLVHVEGAFALTAKVCYPGSVTPDRPFTAWWRLLLSCGHREATAAEIDAFASAIGHTADGIERQAACERARAFRQWAKMATERGGGAAHAFTRIPKGWKEALVPGGWHPTGGPNGSSAETQRVVDAEIVKWQIPWAAVDTPPEQLPPWPIMERLVPSLDCEIRKAACSYSWRTGLGLDQMHPKHLTLASSQCLYMLGYFFYCCEAAGNWAEAMQYFTFFLLGKPTGSFRTIGLLNGLYRIWAKLKMPLVRAWAATIPRPYFSAGQGKSTEQAVGRILMQAEAARDDEEAACIIADIDKCYENVSHEKLVCAAKVHGFPLGILRLCIGMYRAARAVTWGGVFSKWVFSPRTLVPGCSVALWLLQLVMLTPLDELLSQLPRQVINLEVYVDDASLQLRGKKGEVFGAAVRASKALISAFEDGACLPISKTKGKVVASTAALATRIASSLKRWGYQAMKAVTILGVDAAAGRAGVHKPMRNRMNAQERGRAGGQD